MRILLDTHTLLWLLGGDKKLTDNCVDHLSDPSNLYWSDASIWELAIKIGSKKLTLSKSLTEIVNIWLPYYEVNILPISTQHCLEVESLPQHHKDPFDRILIAQAKFERMKVMSIDSIFDHYPVQRIW